MAFSIPELVRLPARWNSYVRVQEAGSFLRSFQHPRMAFQVTDQRP